MIRRNSDSRLVRLGGQYIGTHPWRYDPHDVRVELGPGSAPPPPGSNFLQRNGVLANLVIGYLFMQVYGTSGDGVLDDPDREDALPLLWPVWKAESIHWPPAQHIDDRGLPLWAERLLHRPS
jgi:hypothetical protein